MSNIVLSANNIFKFYERAEEKLEILKGATIEVAKGEIVGLIGPSGSGKSTFLHIMGLLDTPNKGSIKINNKECSKMPDADRTLMRSKEIGFIYQYHHLLSEFTAIENVMMPLRIQGISKFKAKQEAHAILKALGLGHRIDHLASKLSGGEQQRVAIARAIVTKPSIILADEPTGSLDPTSSKAVFDLLIQIVQNCGLSMLIVTHNMHLTKNLSKLYAIEDGKIIKEY